MELSELNSELRDNYFQFFNLGCKQVYKATDKVKGLCVIRERSEIKEKILSSRTNRDYPEMRDDLNAILKD